MHGHACKQHIFPIFQSYKTSTFNDVRFEENPFTCQCENRQDCLSVSNFVLLWVIFKWHHGSEGVKYKFKILEALY